MQIVPKIPVSGQVTSPADIAEKIGAGRTALTVADVLNEINSHFVPHSRGTLKLATDLPKAPSAELAQSEAAAARGDDGSPSMLPHRSPGSPRGLLPALASRPCKPVTEHGRVQPDRNSTIDALSEAERDAYDKLHVRIPESGTLDIYISRQTRSSDGRFRDVSWDVRVADIDGNRWVSVSGVRLDQVVSEVIARWSLGQFDPDPLADEEPGDDD